MSERSPIVVNAAIVGERPTGLGIYALRAIEALAALGERLIVFTSREELVNGVMGVERAPTMVRPERGALGHLARVLWVQTGLRLRIRRLRPAALLNLTPEGLLASAVPQVTVIHDVLPLRYPEEYPRQQHYFRHYVPRALRASRVVVASSQSTCDDVVRSYGLEADKIFVVPCGYDPRRFHPGPAVTNVGDPYALYVGNIMPHKNLLRLIDAFAQATRQAPGRLVLRGWGRPPHVAALRARIAHHRLQRQVDWQPYAGEDELACLYRGARMLLLPSLYEGFGLTALEAMACGTPVVAANTSSLPEVVGDAACLIDPLDTGALADAIGRLFADDGLATDLRERGLTRAVRFSWERTGRGLQAALHAAVGDGG